MFHENPPPQNSDSIRCESVNHRNQCGYRAKTTRKVVRIVSGVRNTRTLDTLSAHGNLTGGPSGTFTPTDRRCGKDGCAFTGDFISHDGEFSRTGIELHDDARSPVAYTTDYDWRWKLFGGTALMAFCLTAPIFLIRAVKRHSRRIGPRPAYSHC
ncbi:hypothetical protein [Nocardia sp. CC227C]|uniref:hypothetical protein n=1 Tax=Nocardia sp. CC227C TaxID=3044562 RepID=UPI00278C405C|nr:hypothetical protein [Nocardia sp. CC227C]